MFTPQELEMLICGEKVTLWFHSTFWNLTLETLLLSCVRSLISMNWRVPQSTMEASAGRLHVSDGMNDTVLPWLKLPYPSTQVPLDGRMIQFCLNLSSLPTLMDWKSSVFHRFWEAVHSMALEDKRKLLQFTTGRLVGIPFPIQLRKYYSCSECYDFYPQWSDPCWRSCQTETDYCKEWPRLWQVPNIPPVWNALQLTLQASLRSHLLQCFAPAWVFHQGEDERPAHEGHQGVQGLKVHILILRISEFLLSLPLQFILFLLENMKIASLFIFAFFVYRVLGCSSRWGAFAAI